MITVGAAATAVAAGTRPSHMAQGGPVILMQPIQCRAEKTLAAESHRAVRTRNLVIAHTAVLLTQVTSHLLISYEPLQRALRVLSRCCRLSGQ